MKRVQTIEDVYPAIDELIVELRAFAGSNLANILDHRMHRVAWTDRAELLEELQRVLSKTLEDKSLKLPEPAERQIQLVLQVIGAFLTASGHQ
jgi:hypothetical protein